MGGAARLPYKGPKTREAALERPWIREGKSSLLSQRVAGSISVRSPGRAKGCFGLRQLLQPLRQTQKSPPEASGGHTSSFCIYCIILQSVAGNVKGQVASGRVPRRTRCAAKAPVRKANLGHGGGCWRGSALGFPDDANKFPDMPDLIPC